MDGTLEEVAATVTDESGYYVVSGMEPGTYTLSVDLGRRQGEGAARRGTCARSRIAEFVTLQLG